MASDVPDRMVILDEYDARFVLRLLFGVERLLRRGVPAEDLALLTGDGVPEGPDPDERLAELVSRAALAIGRQLR